MVRVRVRVILGYVVIINMCIALGGCKFSLYGLKYNTYRCTHIQRDVITTYYPNPNPNHKRALNLGPETLHLIFKLQFDGKDGGLRP